MNPAVDLMLDVFVYAVLPALAAAGCATALVERLGGPRQAHAAAAVGFIAGALLGLWLREALTVIGGESSWNRLHWAALAALMFDRIAHNSDVHFGDGWFLRAGAAVALAWWVIPEPYRAESVWMAPALALVVFANWEVLGRLAGMPASSSVAVALILSLLAAGGVLLFAGHARLLNVNIVLASALTGVWLVAYWRGVPITGAIPGLAVALPGVLLMGVQERPDETIHRAAFALPAAAPLVCAATWPIAEGPRWRVHLARLALVALPLIAALVLASEASPLPMGDEWD